MEQQNSSIKLSIVGDGPAGKPSFVTSFAESSPPHNHGQTGRILMIQKYLDITTITLIYISLF